MTAASKITPSSDITDQSGFVLPFVLIAIAALAIIAAVAFRTITAASDGMAALQREAQAELALQNAEAEAIFTFITAQPMLGGVFIQLPERQDNSLSLLGSINPDDIGENDLWSANGGERRSTASQLQTRVIYRDSSGFTPLMNWPEERIEDFLLAAGLPREDARLLSARIIDYQDDDSRRTPRGAERAEYRLRGANPPTNSPLRTYQELTSVLELGEIMPSQAWPFIQKYTRFNGFGTDINPNFAEPPVAALSLTASDGATAKTVIENNAPSARARFLLETRPEAIAGAGLTRRRAIEIMRSANAVDRPFRREWIYDKAADDVGPSDNDTNWEQLAPLFDPALD